MTFEELAASFSAPGSPGSHVFLCKMPEGTCKMLVSACVRRQQLLAETFTSKKIRRRGMGHISAAAVQKRLEFCIACKEGAENMRSCGLEPLSATLIKPDFPVAVFEDTGHPADEQDFVEVDDG